MASNNGGGEQQSKKTAELGKPLKEGERILEPSRRPDGTHRKPVRIRAGYVPQEEVAIYQSKGALWKKEMASQVGPPGYDPPTDTKLKTKSAKRNERKKEKRVQAALEKGKNSEAVADNEIKGDGLTEEDLDHGSESNDRSCCFSNPVSTSPLSNSVDASDAVTPAQDLDKKIRALKKKIRLVEAQQQKTPQQDMKPEQLEKLAKLEGWREELKLLEDKKAEFAAL
ncbi:hypothetical protein ERO13_D02G232500v2 [Gossypium hirsutum]|uniref:Partner of Y14 and mago n=7 Tax=Gossypium TaxID=3633 RepID=A0ABM2ZSC3_GOSHI|nr:partner of Y14 and mago-like [Gossypium hirsutum]KAG4160365.1 hypothetical protein ERO13_D02G232500v2 [Gossypium hirsutum]MBA0799336.1 hypothetical protein [Gossypium harknessii]TYH85704.1 hypothetical protein ES332_D02G287000v1 [Gossypium tomentosum]TYI95343.1 hypothetical protein E1A91_D02G272800v1 [Gossypium mustelinum]